MRTLISNYPVMNTPNKHNTENKASILSSNSVQMAARLTMVATLTAGLLHLSSAASEPSREKQSSSERSTK